MCTLMDLHIHDKKTDIFQALDLLLLLLEVATEGDFGGSCEPLLLLLYTGKNIE